MHKKIALYITLLCLNSILLNAQVNSAKDSLLVEYHLDKAIDFEQTNIDSAIWHIDEAYKLAQETNSLFLKCRSSLGKAMMYQNISDYKKSALFYKEGITLAEKLNYKPLLAQAYNGFGNLFGLQKQMTQAAEYFKKALAISKELDDKRKVSVILMNLANIEYNAAYYSNDFKKCNEAYNEAYKWAILAKDTGQQISCLGKIGRAHV